MKPVSTFGVSAVDFARWQDNNQAIGTSANPGFESQMKKHLTSAIVSIVLCASAFAANLTIKTLDGKTLTNVEVNKIHTDSVRLVYSDGIVDVPFANLSLEDKKMLGIQARLDLIKQREDERKESEKKIKALHLASQRLSKEIDAANYPPELRFFVQRYNLNVALRNKNAIDTATDIHEALAFLDPATASQSEYEKIQREYEYAGARLTPEIKQLMKREASRAVNRLQFDLEALDEYKDLIVGADNETTIRNAMEKGETFIGMPDFAFRVVKGMPFGRDGSVRLKYLNSKGLLDYYYLKDGKLVSEENN